MKGREFYRLRSFNPSNNLSMIIIINAKFLPRDEQSEEELIKILDMSNRHLENSTNTNYIFN